MPELFIITDEWNEQSWMNTGGTRAKKYLQAPDGKFYYFKRSQIKPGKDYRYEFWSEVIAFELGTMLGFNLLRYDIAIDGEIMGCISESMINSEQEELIEGVKYLQAFSPLYDPSAKEHQAWYTFQMIVHALEKAKLREKIEHIIEIIVFDTLIGNGDRHQENWAVISKQKLMYEAIEELEKTKEFGKSKRWFRWLLTWMKRNMRTMHQGLKEKGKKSPKAFYMIENRFAPIYDSGSSLGRELVTQRVEALLQSDDEIQRYIDRGLSEIHWNGKKVNHFELIKNLLDSPLYNEIVKTIINRVLKKWNGPEIDRIVQAIDQLVPDSHNVYKIPQSRKQLIFKIITLRGHRLAALIHERI